MEFVAGSYPLTSPPLVLSGNFLERVKQISSLAVSAINGNFFSAILTFCFTLVGTLLGAMTGTLKFMIVATVGAIYGAFFSIVLWHSDDSRIRYLIDVIAGLLSGRLVREKISRAMLSAVQTQMGAVETSIDEIQNIFDIDTSGVKGLSVDSVEKLPRITITRDNNFDASGERVSCSVCLQDFELGETVRSLPHCNHVFHLPCIDTWLLMHGSCALCRRDL